MAKVEPINPVEPTGDGKSFLERMQRGMKNSDPETQKKFAETLERMVSEGKAERAARNEYKKVEANTRVGGVGGGSGGGGGADMPPGFMPGKKGGKGIDYKKGGKVSSASSRGDGIAKRGKTKGRMV